MNLLCEFFNKLEIVEYEQLVFERNENKQNSILFKKIDANSNFEAKRCVISNLNNENICENVEGDVLLENLTDTSIKLFGIINSLKIRNAFACQIKLHGICNGSIYIEFVKGGKILIAGDQIRIHDSSDVDIIIFSKNSCVLENCENLRFYPNRSAMKNYGNCSDESYWNRVQDFGFNSENSFKLIDIDLIDE